MATTLDALEALLQFRESVRRKTIISPARSHFIPSFMHVPNPLDPTQPHIIEGDTLVPTSDRRAFGRVAKSAFSSEPKTCIAPIVTTVPNPLAIFAEKHTLQHPMPAPISSIKVLNRSSTQKQISSQQIVTNHHTPISTMSSDADPRQALEVEVRTDETRRALNSKSQRGKKRPTLNDSERLESTKTRNSEHAQSTRMKKKARFQELIVMENEYLVLKEKEVLCRSRRQHLVEYVEDRRNASGEHEVNDCLHSRLKKLASEEIVQPEFSIIDTVALNAENSGMVKVSVRGTDLESGDTKTLSGLICVDFTPGKADIIDVFLYWFSPASAPYPASIRHSVSVLSFDHICSSPPC